MKTIIKNSDSIITYSITRTEDIDILQQGVNDLRAALNSSCDFSSFDLSCTVESHHYEDCSCRVTVRISDDISKNNSWLGFSEFKLLAFLIDGKCYYSNYFYTNDQMDLNQTVKYIFFRLLKFHYQ